jgi:hypothetical protein
MAALFEETLRPEMGIAAEDGLQIYLILHQKSGSGLTKHELMVLAFNFMKKLEATRRFNRAEKVAG